MTSLSPLAQPTETDDEYKAIEATLLGSARGRWFLSEHGRRARRLDSALLEDAIARLQTSLREPPALLGQLETEIGEVKAFVSGIKSDLVAKPLPDALHVTSANGSLQSPVQAILKTVEDVHEIAWSLQANPFDPAGCEAIARQAARLYTLSQNQAAVSEITLATTGKLDAATDRLNDLLATVAHERVIDDPA